MILSEERESTATEMSTEEQVSKFLMEELVLSPQKMAPSNPNLHLLRTPQAHVFCLNDEFRRRRDRVDSSFGSRLDRRPPSTSS